MSDTTDTPGATATATIPAEKFLFDIHEEDTLKGQMKILYRDFYNEVIKNLFENTKLDPKDKETYFIDALHAYTNYRRITDNAKPFDEKDCAVCLMNCYKGDTKQQIPILIYNESLKQLYDADNKTTEMKKNTYDYIVGEIMPSFYEYTLIGKKRTNTGGMVGGGDYLTVGKIIDDLKGIQPVDKTEKVDIEYSKQIRNNVNSKTLTLTFNEFLTKIADIPFLEGKYTDDQTFSDKKIKTNIPNFKRLYLKLLQEMQANGINVETPINDALKRHLNITEEDIVSKILKHMSNYAGIKISNWLPSWLTSASTPTSNPDSDNKPIPVPYFFDYIKDGIWSKDEKHYTFDTATNKLVEQPSKFLDDQIIKIEFDDVQKLYLVQSN